FLVSVSDRVLAFVVFFFSSRRRHTRSKRDWSSDVCSSDLSARRPMTAMLSFFICFFLLNSEREYRMNSSPQYFGKKEEQHSAGRSEERRVGKECRSCD